MRFVTDDIRRYYFEIRGSVPRGCAGVTPYPLVKPLNYPQNQKRSQWSAKNRITRCYTAINLFAKVGNMVLKPQGKPHKHCQNRKRSRIRADSAKPEKTAVDIARFLGEASEIS